MSAHWRNVSGIRLDFLGEAALQPLGRELDRGQRIFDLVCDAPRHIGPGGLALGRLQLGDVVEGDDEAIASARRDSSAPMRASKVRRRFGGPIATSRRVRPLRLARRLAHQRRNSGTTSASGGRLAAIRSMLEQLVRGAVGQLDPARRRRGRSRPAETPDSTVSVKRRRSSIWL